MNSPGVCKDRWILIALEAQSRAIKDRVVNGMGNYLVQYFKFQICLNVVV